MPKNKKESHAFSIRMAKEIYERMEKYCEETSVPKTAVVERAICMYLDDYEETRKQLKELKQKLG